MKFVDPDGNWGVEIIEGEDGKKELSFKAEDGDNLETLATQLGKTQEELKEAFGKKKYKALSRAC
ncbi:MAG: hypothetical protein GY777_32930 [Candidatus Brocadiaceae bacterium]|nr:hypothetical protein [Candidatus Brocadiaceae bacterium]